MQQCGFCCMLSTMLRRAICVSSRRGSSETYRELGEQEGNKFDDKSSSSGSQDLKYQDEERMWMSQIIGANDQYLSTGPFLTLHKRRKKRLLTRSLCQDCGMLDDVQPGQVQLMLGLTMRWTFNAFTLESVSGGRSVSVLCMHLFNTYGLLHHFQLDVLKAWKLFSLIEEGYHSSNPYHNCIHAADVTQAMHCFLQQKQIRENMEPLEIMACLIAAVAHDVDHPGVNQPFLIATSNHLAALYKNTSVLENHHWRTAISCLNESGLVDQVEGRLQLQQHISSLILATDIARQQVYLTRFKVLMDNNTLDLAVWEHRHLVLQMALKCADLSNPCRPWEISRKWSLRVCEEFFRQGDYERKLNLPVTALCDRHTSSIPKIQTGFLKFVVTPLISEWHRFLQTDLTSEILQNLRFNQGKWEALEAQEAAEETRTEISDADMVDDDLETNVSDSSELLLPTRRSSFQPVKSGFKEQLRRLSAPLTVFQDSKKRDQPVVSALGQQRDSICSSEHSLHSQLSSRLSPGREKQEPMLSSEKLLPDSSIASITTPRQATRLNSVLRSESGSWKLIRQQTFPPLENAPRRAHTSLHTSDEDDIYAKLAKTDLGHIFDITKIDARLSMFKRSLDKTEKDDVSKCDDSDSARVIGKKIMNPTLQQMYDGGRRESAPVGSQLRDNMAPQGLISSDLLTRRRKSMPTDTLPTAKEKNMREVTSTLPALLSRRFSAKENWSKRRGSAPATLPQSDLRTLVNMSIRHSVNGGGLKRGTTIATCHHWLSKAYAAQEYSGLPRRSSLPVEMLTGAPTH